LPDQTPLNCESRVNDHRIVKVENLWTDSTEEEVDGDIGVLTSGTMLAKAKYTYDRLENVVEAEVGIDSGTLQTRTFIIDQRGRLRKETHPEMPTVEVVYEDFDHYDNPQTIKHQTSTASLRTWLNTYDIAGNLLQLDAGDVVVDYVYNYDAAFGANPTPYAFPEFPREIRYMDTDTQNGNIALYRHTYDVNHGLLLERSLFHDRAGFPGESSVDLSAYTLGSASPPTLVGSGLDLSYAYDSLGRLTQMVYPGVVNGLGDPTALDYTYGSHGLLTSVEDSAFETELVLFKNLTYGVGDQLTNADYAAPLLTDKNRLLRSFDALNRLNTWKVAWNGAGHPVGYSHQRDYGYDLGGRIHQIQIDPDPNSSQFKGFRYAYEGLNQIAQGTLTKPDTLNTTTWTFGYDDKGFGNLVSFKEGVMEYLDAINLSSNRIAGNATYTDLGELEVYEDENSTTSTMTYNDLGRMKTLASTNLNALYQYDHAGMRMFTQVTGSAAASETQTLYFYDADGMVLCEWVADKDGSNWTGHRWDRTYVYLAGKSSITYEYDGVDPGQISSTPSSGPEITNADFIDEPLFEWEDVGPGTYDLEVKDHLGREVASVRGVAGNQWRQRRLKFGKYQVRARLTDQVWGDWQTLNYMDATSQEQVGIYPLDWEALDHSFYRNDELQPDEGTHYIEGKNSYGLFLSQGESLNLPTPHQYLTGTHGSVSFWAKPIVDTGSEEVGPDLDLWSLGDLRLTINQHGRLKVKYTGSSPFQPNISATGLAWQHFAIVYGNGSLKVYLDNVLSFDLTSVPTSGITTSDMRWGDSSSSSGAATGIDEIRCFDKALTTTEINDEYTRWN